MMISYIFWYYIVVYCPSRHTRGHTGRERRYIEADTAEPEYNTLFFSDIAICMKHRYTGPRVIFSPDRPIAGWLIYARKFMPSSLEMKVWNQHKDEVNLLPLYSCFVVSVFTPDRNHVQTLWMSPLSWFFLLHTKFCDQVIWGPNLSELLPTFVMLGDSICLDTWTCITKVSVR